MCPARRGFNQARGSRRKRGWEEGPGSITAVVAQPTANGITLLGNGQEFQFDGDPLVRIRGSLQMHLTAATGINDGFHCAMGIALASQNAFGVGVTALMSPLDDIEWDGWIYHRVFDLHGLLTTASGMTEIQFEIDTKAMRKLKAQDTIYAVLQHIETGTATADVWMTSRMLLLLP